jgi:hypothetical protein
MVLDTATHASIDEPPANRSWVVDDWQLQPWQLAVPKFQTLYPGVDILLLLPLERDQEDASLCRKALRKLDDVACEVDAPGPFLEFACVELISTNPIVSFMKNECIEPPERTGHAF